MIAPPDDRPRSGADPARPPDPHASELWWRLALVVGAVAIALTLAAGVSAAAIGYRPTADHATLAIRADDVGTSRTPLLGTRSSVSPAGDAVMHHPGPLELYLLAPFVWIAGGTGIPLGGSVFIAVAIAGLIALCRRAGSGQLAFGAAVTSLALVGTIGAADLASPWPPVSIVVPFEIVAVAAWLVATGDRKARWALVAVGSFCAQTHLAVLPLVVVIGLGAVLVDGYRQRSERSFAVALTTWLGPTLVGLTLWAPPVIEQFTDAHPNMTEIVRSSTGGTAEKVGFVTALKNVSATLDSPLGWIGSRWRAPWFHTDRRAFFDAGTPPPRWLVIIGGLAIVALLTMWIIKPGRRAVRRPLAISIVVLVALCTAVFARAPFTAGYLSLAWLRWLWGVGALIWAVLLAEGIRGTRRLPPRALAAAGMAIALVSVGIGITNVRSSTAFWFRERDAVVRLNAGMLRATHPGERLVIRSDVAAAGASAAVFWELQDAGRNPIAGRPTFVNSTSKSAARFAMFGDERRQAVEPSDRELRVVWIGANSPTELGPRDHVIASASVSIQQAQDLIDERYASVHGLTNVDDPTGQRALESALAHSPGYPVVIVERR